MRKIGLYILLMGLFMACQKEEEITARIDYENLYEILDDPSDSIQHKRYELYQKYGVPVFFNDTVGKVFVKVDVNGDSVFQYETLDLSWAFSSTNANSVKYQITQMTDPDKQMKALQFVDTFLFHTYPALYPHALWLTDKCYEISSTGAIQTSLICRYRNMMFSSMDETLEGDFKEEAKNIRNQVIKVKILNFEDQLKAFYEVTDEEYYNKEWFTLYPEESLPHWSHAHVNWNPKILGEVYGEELFVASDGGTIRDILKKYYEYTDEEVDNYATHCRRLVGAYGFVYHASGKYGFRTTPMSNGEDLDTYLREMLTFPRAEFLERWEDSPLVMKKYNLLYELIRDELGVEL